MRKYNAWEKDSYAIMHGLNPVRWIQFILNKFNMCRACEPGIACIEYEMEINAVHAILDIGARTPPTKAMNNHFSFGRL